jgi:hypothetical protein
MNQGDVLSALEVHALAERSNATMKRGEATAAVNDSLAYANKFVGDDMQQMRAQLKAQGQAKADDCLAAALRHDERASTAEKGYLLHGDAEQRDPAYALSKQSLITGAGKHGLMTSTPM